MNNIKDNLKNIRERIENAAKEAGRDPDSVKLIAVSKTKPADDINEAIKWGVTDIGENKVQEVMDKYEIVQPVNWHFIGHLQRNKVKYIIDKVKLIHSVDSLKLAREIDKKAASKNLTMDILIQINTGEEDNKYGTTFKDAPGLIREILDECEHINIKGLMSVVPIAEDPEEVSMNFRLTKQLFDRLADEIHHERFDAQHLSMGMTHDFETAIKEGSTMVRVGTAIFGERNYNKEG